MNEESNQSSVKIDYRNSDNPREALFAPLLEYFDELDAKEAQRAAKRAKRAAEGEEREAQEATKNQSTTTATQSAENREPEALLSEDDASVNQEPNDEGNDRNDAVPITRKINFLEGPFARNITFRRLPEGWMSEVRIPHHERIDKDTQLFEWASAFLEAEWKPMSFWIYDIPPVLCALVPFFAHIATCKITLAMVWQVRFIYENSRWHKESGIENLKHLVKDLRKVAEMWAAKSGEEETEKETEKQTEKETEKETEEETEAGHR